ncbi:MAG TPA: iron chelate uptake ABC transporter family permease subunit [Pseudomonadales bacterium]|nr:iron chelate uptake ABC transporter family permease subunit [Pseudomonadales bacterium]
MTDFFISGHILLLPLLAGIGTALLAGPLGCFVVWQRMAYFGESLSHSALLGVAIGLWFKLPPTLTVIGAGVLLAFLLAGLQQSTRFSSDTLLGILSHTLLAAGLVLLSALPNLRVDLDALLFGDLLAVSLHDVMMLAGLLLVLAVGLWRLWQPLIAITVHEEMASAEGIHVGRVRTALMLMMALTVAVAMKVVGVLLMTSLLIIPAAIAQRYARSPEQMAWMASLTGVLAVIGGLLLSWFSNSPIGPSIVLLAGIFFLNSLAVDGWKNASTRNA